MALTLSNRETFLVLEWLEQDPGRRARMRAEARRLERFGVEMAVPRMSAVVADEVESEMPQLNGLAAELLKSGSRRVNFFELALAFLTEDTPLDVAVVLEAASPA